jgi:hypothetical protein
MLTSKRNKIPFCPYTLGCYNVLRRLHKPYWSPRKLHNIVQIVATNLIFFNDQEPRVFRLLGLWETSIFQKLSNLKISGTKSPILRNLPSPYNKKGSDQYWSELWMVISKLLLAIGGFVLARFWDGKRSLVT